MNLIDYLKDIRDAGQRMVALYSPAYGNVVYSKIVTVGNVSKIICHDGDGEDVTFRYDGRIRPHGEVQLFPSATEREWRFFDPYNNGDVVLNNETGTVHVYKKGFIDNGELYFLSHVFVGEDGVLETQVIDGWNEYKYATKCTLDKLTICNAESTKPIIDAFIRNFEAYEEDYINEQVMRQPDTTFPAWTYLTKDYIMDFIFKRMNIDRSKEETWVPRRVRDIIVDAREGIMKYLINKIKSNDNLQQN